MKPPSKNWQNLRKAVLERAYRTTIDPLQPLFSVYIAVCIFYLAGLLRFQFFDQTAVFTVMEAVQLVCVALAGLLVPVLTGSVVTLCIASRRLQKLAEE